MIVDGFDLDSALVCEGIVGDGCGGGRIFYIKEHKLFAYDPYSKITRELFDAPKNTYSIKKKGCVITMTSQEMSVDFDLSTLKE